MKAEIVKCYVNDGSYMIKFRNNLGQIHTFSDYSLESHNHLEYTKIEPLEQIDTLQEVIEWCKNNETRVTIDDEGLLWNNQDFIGSKSKFINHIRTPKLQEITPEELAEMGYKLKNY